MQLRRGAVATSAGTLALVLLGGPMLGSQARAAGPSVIVRQGDTLSGIAARFGTTVARLVALNRIRDADLILPGEVIILSSGARAAGSTNGAPSRVVVHVVNPGENLTTIAARYGTSVTAIVASNQLGNANHIVPGQRLRILTSGAAPAGQPASTGAPTTAVHVVSSGETLSGIAWRNATSIAVLVSLNHLPSAGYIQVGQRLLVPSTHRSIQTNWSTARLGAQTQGLMARRAWTRDLIVTEAQRAGVPVSLALAVAWQESGWRQSAVSGAGAIGVMQLLPDTAEWIADAMLHAPVDIHDTRSNVRAGVTLLKHYLVRYRGDLRRALAAYYQGQRAVDRHGIFPVSRPYIASILLLEEMLEP